ncbi:plexin domain-containing protein 1-like isoform X2 [Watersipora subatra]|uniref:plexin domain-containing protein 1-like isoform X2 n=1 Tax=Watersipora subatra TaxID=2589382 RepID=UPI00355BB350
MFLSLINSQNLANCRHWQRLLVVAAVVSSVVSTIAQERISYNVNSVGGLSNGRLIRIRRDANANILSTGSPLFTTGSSVATAGSSVATAGSSTATTGSSVGTAGPSAATPESSVATAGPSAATTGSSVATAGPSAATTGSSVATSGPSAATTGSSVATTRVPVRTSITSAETSSISTPFHTSTGASLSTFNSTFRSNQTVTQQSPTATDSTIPTNPNTTLVSQSTVWGSMNSSASSTSSTPQASPSGSELPTTASKTTTRRPSTPVSMTTVKYESTTEFIDDRDYYALKYVTDAKEGRKYWRDIDKEGPTYTHSFLEGRTRALQLAIPFNFTYYGHDVNKITVAIGGFLYMSDFLHKYLSATQYIAPLMADFNSSINAGVIYYSLLNDAVVFEWRNLHLHLQPEAGPFTFQVQLYKDSGQIVFAYKDVPLPVKNISDELHSVKVGIADAYYYDYGFLRTIYEYHNIDIDFEKVKSDVAIIFNHQPTCNLLTDCNSCHNEQLSDFTCFWCSAVSRCSDTKDRGRQDWQRNSCPYENGLASKETCTESSTTASITGASNQNSLEQNATKKSARKGETAGIVIAVILLVIIAGLVILYIYSYGHPSSTPGQFLIKYRPSQLVHRWQSRGNKESTYRVDSQVLSNEAYEG